MSFNTCTFVLLTTPLRSIFCACLFLYCTKRSDFHQDVVICLEWTSLRYKSEHHSIIRVNITPFIRSELKEWQSLPHLECALWQHFHSSFGVTFTPSFLQCEAWWWKVQRLCWWYRVLAITSRKHVTKHFHMAKKYCAQWQLNGSWCLTHNLCAIFTGSTQRDNCAIVTVNIIKT